MIGTDLEENTEKPLADAFAKKVFFKVLQSSRQSACVGTFVSKVVSSNINEVIRSVLNFLFFYSKISEVQKRTKRIQGTKSTKKH